MAVTADQHRVSFFRKLIAGDPYRRTRFHDSKGNLIAAAECWYLPQALHRLFMRKVFGRLYVEPWWTFGIKKRVGKILAPGMTVVEFGSGQSSLWLAQRVGSVLSIESNPEWATRVRAQAEALGLSNLTVADREEKPAYWDVDGIEDGSVDFCVIDGYARDRCAQVILPKMRRGGWIYLDNSDAETESDEEGRDILTAGDILRRHVPAERIEYFTGLTIGTVNSHQGMLCHLA